jgi:hypothetical protein
MKTLYRVEDGRAEPCPPASADVDGENSVLAYANDEADALRLSARYDKGELQPDNVTINGVVYAALQD